MLPSSTSVPTLYSLHADICRKSVVNKMQWESGPFTVRGKSTEKHEARSELVVSRLIPALGRLKSEGRTVARTWPAWPPSGRMSQKMKIKVGVVPRTSGRVQNCLLHSVLPRDLPVPGPMRNSAHTSPGLPRQFLLNVVIVSLLLLPISH